jgi:hypothetical protein
MNLSLFYFVLLLILLFELILVDYLFWWICNIINTTCLLIFACMLCVLYLLVFSHCL